MVGQTTEAIQTAAQGGAAQGAQAAEALGSPVIALVMSGAAVFLLAFMFAITPVILRRRHERLNRQKVIEIATYYGIEDWSVTREASAQQEGLSDTQDVKRSIWVQVGFWTFFNPYFLPLSTTVLIVTIYAIAVLLLSPDIYVNNCHKTVLMLANDFFANGACVPKGEGSYIATSMSVVLGAFLGGFVWSSRYIYRRLASYDLFPLAYFHVSLHFIEGAFVAIALRHILGPQLDASWTAVLLGFVVGYAPDLGLHRIFQIWRKFTKEESASEHGSKIPKRIALRNISGISSYIRARLDEFEIDDVQNLAMENPIIMYARTPFELAEVVDWIAQAQLLLYLGEDHVIKLRKYGIRNIFMFQDMCEKDSEFVSRVLNGDSDFKMSADSLEALAKSIASDPSYFRLNKLREQMSRERKNSRVEDKPLEDGPLEDGPPILEPAPAT